LTSQQNGLCWSGNKIKKECMKMLKRFLKEEAGQGMVEYGLIIALVAVVLIAALTLMGGNLKGMFENVADKVSAP